MNAYTVVQTMKPRGSAPFDRVFLYCPRGHECASTPATNKHAERWLAGDFSGEFCGTSSCDWEGEA